MAIKTITRFIALESAAGVLLFASSVFAVIVSNSSFSFIYEAFLHTPVFVGFASQILEKPLILWINDGLMAIFFLLVGLEIKRELLQGELNSVSKVTLPLVAAIGGMLGPALIYMLINRGNDAAIVGWAIPTATDIAFSLGVISLLGSRVPLSLKLFLTAIAIFDDIGAILIIGLYYSSDLQGVFFIGAAACIITLYILNRARVMTITPYAIVGILLWLCVLKSGIHATLAGVILAFAIPIGVPDGAGGSPLRTLEHSLNPWVAFGVLPLFGFANAGLSFSDVNWHDIFSPISIGIICGLVIGKTCGVFGATWLMVKWGFAEKPANSSWRTIFGVACACGIGFTMSLFIGALALHGGSHFVSAKIGVFIGSIIAGSLAYIVLRTSPATKPDLSEVL